MTEHNRQPIGEGRVQRASGLVLLEASHGVQLDPSQQRQPQTVGHFVDLNRLPRGSHRPMCDIDLNHSSS